MLAGGLARRASAAANFAMPRGGSGDPPRGNRLSSEEGLDEGVGVEGGDVVGASHPPRREDGMHATRRVTSRTSLANDGQAAFAASRSILSASAG